MQGKKRKLGQMIGNMQKGLALFKGETKIILIQRLHYLRSKEKEKCH